MTGAALPQLASPHPGPSIALTLTYIIAGKEASPLFVHPAHLRHQFAECLVAQPCRPPRLTRSAAPFVHPAHLRHQFAEGFVAQPRGPPCLTQQREARVGLRQDEGRVAEGHDQDAGPEGDVEALGGIVDKLICGDALMHVDDHLRVQGHVLGSPFVPVCTFAMCRTDQGSHYRTLEG